MARMQFGLLFALLIAGGTALAQTGTGVITGVVADSTKAPVPGVVVTVANQNTGATLRTETNEAGIYRVGALAPGEYSVRAEREGFETSWLRNIPVSVAQVLSVDLELKVGVATTVLQVESAPTMVESQTSSAGQLIGRRMVAGLPMPNRAATSLVALAPGVVVVDSGQGAENYPVFSVAGGRVRNQNFTLDGANVTNAVGLTRPQQMTSLPMDAMQEFRVISNSYAAEHGHSTGGVVALSTRSGTNEFHGSLFEFHRNGALDARNFFAREKPPLRMNQFGGTLGGPIIKDRSHFFASWEQTRQLSSVTTLQTVPSLAQRTGDFSGLRNSSGQPVTIYDPATTVGRDRQSFANNVIPASRFDPVSQQALAYWPSPNRGASVSGANNYSNNNNSSLNRNIFVARVDHQLRPQDQLTFRYYLNDSFIENGGAFGNPVSDPDANSNDARIQSFLGSHTHTFSPAVVNELKVTFFQRKFIDQRYGAGEDYAGQLGLTGVSSAAFPNFVLPGYASLAGQVGRIQTPIRDLQFLESLSWIRGRHAFKFGVEHRRASNQEIRDRSSSGQFQISPLITSHPQIAGTGDALASFLLGEVNSANVNVSDTILSRAYYWAFYAQDDWRVSDRLTLNLGMRWEAELPRRVDEDRQNSFDLYKINPVSGTPGIVTFSGRNGVPRPAFRTDRNNFGPRVGFAYRLPFARETVVRGGAGVFFGSTVSNTIGDTASTGFSTSSSLVVSQPELLSAMRLSEGFPPVVRPPLDDAFGAVPVGSRPNTAVGFFEPERPTPLSYQFNLSVQREVSRDVVVELGYIGNVSHHLTGNDLSLNQVRPELLGPGNTQTRRPFPQFSNVYWINPAIGNSTYHGGFARAEKRFSGGVSFLAHYTFSKFIDDVASSNEYGDPQSYMDAYNRRLDKGLSGSDVPHRLVVSALYEVPQFRGRRMWNAALGGWKTGVLATLQSGPTFTVTTAANTTNAFSAGPLRPNLTSDPRLSGGERSLSRWFDTSAFAAPAPFSFGNAPRSVLRGDSTQQVDLTLSKEFAVTERWKVEARGEFYNVLNHATFELPGRVLGSPDFGTVLSARAPRTIQVGLRIAF